LTRPSPSLLLLWILGTPSQHPDLTHRCLLTGEPGADDAIAVDTRAPEEHACTPQPLHARSAPAPAILDLASTDSRPQLTLTTSVSDLPRETLADAVPLPCMQQTMGTTAIGHRSSSNRMDGNLPYRFRRRRAGRRASWADLAQIWRGPARSGPLSFFSLSIMC
jgi:hypothetical protein